MGSQQKLFYAVRAIPEFFFGMVMLVFPTNGCYWMYRQLLMAQRLLDLIDAPRVVDFRWNTASVRHDASQEALPRLDLTIPRNVQGWASIRRVVYGRNFAPQVELKIQFYVT